MDELAADKPSQRYLPHGNIHKPLHDIYRMAQPPSPGTSNAADKKKKVNSAKALLFYVTHPRFLYVFLCVYAVFLFSVQNR